MTRFAGSATTGKARGIAVTIALAFLALNAASLLVVSGLNVYFNIKNEREMIAGQQRLVTLRAADSVKDFIRDKLVALQSATVFGELAAARPETRRLLLDKLLGVEPSFRQLVLVDERRQVLARASRMSQLAKGQLTEARIEALSGQATRSGGGYLSPVYIDEMTSEPMMLAAINVTDAGGGFRGMVIAEVSLKFMWDLIDGIKAGRNGLAYVIDRKGDLIAFRDVSRVLKGENVRHLAGVRSFLRDRAERNTIPLAKGIQGGYVSVAYAPLGMPDWAVVVEVPASEAYRTVAGNVALSAAILLASFVLALLVGVSLSRRIARPLLDLRDAARKISRGERNADIAIASKDEIGELAASFNQMVADLRDTTVSVKELEKERKRFRDIAFISADWIWEVDENGVYTDCSERVKDVMGYAREEIIGKTPFDFMPPEERERVKDEFLRKAKRNEMVRDFENWNIRKDGRKICALTSGIPLFDEQGNFRGYRGVDKDITEKKLMEELLQEEKERLSVTLRSIGDGVIATDMDGKAVLLNRVAEELTGWKQEDAAGRPVDEVFRLVSEETRRKCENPVRKALETKSAPPRGNAVLVSRDGAERIVEESVAPIRDKKSRIIGAVIAFRDITEKRKMELEQIRAQKLESIGVLAGGIAHDFNNILTGITANISVVRTHIGPDSPLAELCDEMEQASRQAKALTKQLLTFAKGGAPIRKVAGISRLVEETARFALRGSNVRARFNIPPGVWPVEVDQEQIGQVIGNIVLNAVQAMPDGGDIEVSVENGVAELACDIVLKSDRFVKITIKDSGVGMPREHLDRIFDPYFTTKQKGNGLGLATSFSIIRNHRGRIAVESEPGKGAQFSIYLPACEGAAGGEEDATAGVIRGKGKILVMDDEELVGKVTERMLKVLGYGVALARDGEEALALYAKARDDGKAFDAVLMDLTVPGGMGGKELVKRLQETDPGVKAVAVSGYSTDQVMSSYREYGFADILVKPFVLKEIGAVLGAVLGTKGS